MGVPNLFHTLPKDLFLKKFSNVTHQFHRAVGQECLELWGLTCGGRGGCFLLGTDGILPRMGMPWREMGYISYNLYPLGTNISPANPHLKMIFHFLRWDMWVPWRVIMSHKWKDWYCWWKESCTSLRLVVYPVISGTLFTRWCSRISSMNCIRWVHMRGYGKLWVSHGLFLWFPVFITRWCQVSSGCNWTPTSPTSHCLEEVAPATNGSVLSMITTELFHLRNGGLVYFTKPVQRP